MDGNHWCEVWTVWWVTQNLTFMQLAVTLLFKTHMYYLSSEYFVSSSMLPLALCALWPIALCFVHKLCIRFVSAYRVEVDRRGLEQCLPVVRRKTHHHGHRGIGLVETWQSNWTWTLAPTAHGTVMTALLWPPCRHVPEWWQAPPPVGPGVTGAPTQTRAKAARVRKRTTPAAVVSRDELGLCVSPLYRREGSVKMDIKEVRYVHVD